MLRRGTSLIEVLVALTLGALLLSMALSSLLRQNRVTADLVASGQGRAQLRTATALLPAQLALSSPSANDIVRGEARDTALQLRIPVASGIACDAGSTVTMDADVGDGTSAGIASAPRAGDSLWSYRADSARWTGRLVTDAWSATDSCPPYGSAGVHAMTRLRIDPADVVAARTPLRVTRQGRIVVYRAGDGTWQLGLREWSDVTHSLAPPQPVAGPFQRLVTDGARTGFRYFDSLGAELLPAERAEDHARIARIRFVAIVAPPTGQATTSRSSQRDSAEVVVRPSGPW